MTSTITTTANGGTVTEGTSAVITYNLSAPLGSATNVKASVIGVGATAGVDYGALYYHMGSNPASPWTLVNATTGLITLNTGFSDFQLKVDVTLDATAELWESLTFVVSQTLQSAGITGSWYVPSTVALADVGAGLPKAAITLAATSPATATEAVNVDGNANNAAYALYDISLVGGLSATTSINASVTGVGATAGTDYGALYFRTSTLASPVHATAGDWSVWTAVPTSGLTAGQIDLPVSTKHFELSTAVLFDSLVESWETLTFVAAQNGNSMNLENSWYVPGTVSLLDPGAGGAKAAITLAATSPATATEAVNVGDNANNAAYALYDISLVGGLSAATSINASVIGAGATAGTDYGALYFRTSTLASPVHATPGDWSAWTAVPTSGLAAGQIDLLAGVKHFELSTAVLFDSLVESWETLTFVAAQNGNSMNLENSWYVPGTVSLLDPGAGLPKAAITLAATSPATATEAVNVGGNANNAAYALYDISLVGGLSATTSINASVIGAGATAGTDYGALYFRTSTLASPVHATAGDWSVWTAVPTSGLTAGQIDLPVSTRHFELSTAVLFDSLVEDWETLTFVAAQNGNSMNLENSWYVPGTVSLLDPGAGGAKAAITLAADSPTSGDEPAADGGGVNHNAVAKYDISLAGGLSANTWINASVVGVGATSADFNGLSYRTTTGTGAAGDPSWSAWASVPSGADPHAGQIELLAGVKHFELSANVLYDTLVEDWESLTFVAAQNGNSMNLENSWYVGSNVALTDPTGGPGPGGGAPTATVTDNVPGIVTAGTTNVAYTYTFNHSVSDLAVDDFTAGTTNGTVTSVTGSGTVWTVNVTPTAGVASGNINLVMRQGAVVDGDGNQNLASTDSSQAIDTAQHVQLFASNHTTLVGTYDTLKGAVDAAQANGGTDFFIDVGAGSVSVGGAQVVIDKNITITGASMATTTLLADFDNLNNVEATGSRGMILVNSGKTLNVTGLTIDGNGHSVNQAVLYQGGNGTINSVHFDDIKFSTYGGMGVASAHGASVNVTNSVFTDIGRVSVFYDWPGTTGTASGNTFTGKGAGDWLDYAVEVSGGAQVTVSSNTVTGNLGVATSDGSTSAAFLVDTYYDPGTTATFTSNTVSNSTTGVAGGYNLTDSSTITFNAGNVFTTNVSTGVAITGNVVATGTNLVDGTFYWDGGASDNTITGAAGNDTLVGAAGSDNITLGAGNDTLVFTSLTGADTIVDYNVANDSIQLDMATYTSLGAVGALTAGEFLSVANAAALTGGSVALSTNAQEIVYLQDTGALYYNADNATVGGLVLIGTFTGAPALVLGEFTIIVY